MCFSPVAGILLVESYIGSLINPAYICFSPVAGILLVERISAMKLPLSEMSFSPVAGILLVERKRNYEVKKCSLMVSVPLPGFY